MAVRNPKLESITVFNGLDTLLSTTNLPPQSWFESNNVVVSASGSAVALRSPKAWNTSPANSTVLDAFSWNRNPGTSLVLFEEINAGTTVQLYTDAGGNTTVQSVANPTNQRSTWLSAFGRAFFTNDYVVGQIVTTPALSVLPYAVGINPPAAAPSTSITSGGSLVLNVGVTLSYAYRNSVTGHVGLASDPSNNAGPTGTNKTLRVAVVASTQTGVDGIVLFASVDGGDIRFLLIDANDDPLIFPNTTGNIDIASAGSLVFDGNTTETVFNAVPWPTAGAANGPKFMFRHQDRIMLLGFSGVNQSQITYSGLESVGIGQPQEAYPPLNIVTIPVRGEAAIGGISTVVGALIFSDREAYLLSGQLIDIVVSAANTVQASYRLDSLGWGLGTRSPLTIKVTPFGVIWLDQTKRLQMWPYTGLPTEVGISLRNELRQIQDTDAARFMAEATWFQYGEQQYYVLSGSTTGSKNNKLFIIGLYEVPQSQTDAYRTMAHAISISTAVSDIPAQSIISHIDPQGVARCLIVRDFALDGTTADGGLKEILNLNQQGDGWGSTQTIYFGSVTGNFTQNVNWSNVHSIRYDSQATDIMPSTRNFDDSQTEAINPEFEGNENYTYFGMINRYGVHKKIRFTFPTDDTKRREVQNLRITYSGKTRP